MSNAVYVLGGAQSDFARDMHSEGLSVFDLFKETLAEALEQCYLPAEDIQRGHVGNASGDVLTGYAQMGGFFGMADHRLAGMPAGRHEAACASGSMALLGAMADISAGYYDVVCAAGVEVMGVDTANLKEFATVDQAIGSHAWPSERKQGHWVWPYLFSQFLIDYRERYGVDYRHLGEITRLNLENARKNPNARGRSYASTPACFIEDDVANPKSMDEFRKHDTCRTADGAAFVFLASEAYARSYAQRRGIRFEEIPRIKGFGHATMPTELQTKREINQKSGSPYYMPHLHNTIQQALQRASFSAVTDVDLMEVHDCFNISEYMIIDHSGLVQPGCAWQAIEDGSIAPGGRLPVNPSGGLLGAGHPIGCTGVRMALDAYKQVTGQAGDYQIGGAKNAMTVNVGGTLTTTAALIIGCDD